MLLQSGQKIGDTELQSSLTTTTPASKLTTQQQIIETQLDIVRGRLKEGWTAHTAKEGRLYYCK